MEITMKHVEQQNVLRHPIYLYKKITNRYKQEAWSLDRSSDWPALCWHHRSSAQTDTRVCELPAGGAHRSPPRGAGQGTGGEELLPAGEGQDPRILGNLQEEPGGDEGRAEEPTEGRRGGGGAPPSGDHCELHTQSSEVY